MSIICLSHVIDMSIDICCDDDNGGMCSRMCSGKRTCLDVVMTIMGCETTNIVMTIMGVIDNGMCCR